MEFVWSWIFQMPNVWFIMELLLHTQPWQQDSLIMFSKRGNAGLEEFCSPKGRILSFFIDLSGSATELALFCLPWISPIEKSIPGLWCNFSLFFSLDLFMFSLYLFWFAWILAFTLRRLFPSFSPCSTSSYPHIGSIHIPFQPFLPEIEQAEP